MSGRWYSYGQGTKVEIFEMNCIEGAADLIFNGRKGCPFGVNLKGREVNEMKSGKVFEHSHRSRINELVRLF